jgi:hypothetical protein
MFLHLLMAFFWWSGTGSAEAAEWNVVTHVQSAMVTATANQRFGGGPDKMEKKTFEDPSAQVLEAKASDESGAERSAKGEIRLEMEKGIIRFKGKVETTDSNPGDFLAPVTSAKGTVKVDLKVSLPNPSQSLRATFRLNSQGPASLSGEEGKALPANIVVQIWRTEETILQPEDFRLGIEKEISPPLQHGEVLTFLFQTDFTLFSSGQANVVSTLTYTFSQ